MKKLLLLTLLVSLCSCNAPTHYPDPIDITSTNEHPGVYVIQTTTNSTGSAFVVEYKGQQFVVTAKHIFNSLPDEKFVLVYEGKVQNINVYEGMVGIADIVIYGIAGAKHTLKIDPRMLDSKPETVYALGYIKDKTLHKSKGEVISGTLISLAKIQHGMSGGPILNSKGYVVGVNSQMYVGTNNEFIASQHINIRTVVSYMNQWFKRKEMQKKNMEKIQKAFADMIKKFNEQKKLDAQPSP